MSNKNKFRYDYLDKEKNINNYKLNALNKIHAMFLYHDLPNTIPQRELEKILLKGFVGIAEVNGKLYAFDGGLGGELDEYYRPTIFTVSNPFLKLSENFKIDENCVIIKNDSNMQGVYPMIEKFAFMKNENDISRIISVVNARLQIILSASDDNTRQSASDFIQRLFDGKLSTISDNAFLESLKVNLASSVQNQSINNLITHDQYINACFLNAIGLNANTQLKKERLVSAEIENNSESLYPIVDDMLACRREGIEKVNEMFGTNITVEFASSWDLRVLQGASIHNVDEEENPEKIDEEKQDDEEKLDDEEKQDDDEEKLDDEEKQDDDEEKLDEEKQDDDEEKLDEEKQDDEVKEDENNENDNDKKDETN